MGKRERSTASIGIKITLSDLISQINEANVDRIQTMLRNGCIEDENDSFHKAYHSIVHRKDLPQDHQGLKDELLRAFTQCITQCITQCSTYHTPPKCLLDQSLLVPFHTVLTCERRDDDWSRSNPYQDIEKTKIVFMLIQHSD